MTTKIHTRREHTGNRQLDVIQRESQRLAEKANACPFFSGNLVRDRVFAAGVPLTIDHGLGRAPEGWIVVSSHGANAAPPPVKSASQPTDPTLQVTLQTTAAATFHLWFW